MGRRAGESRAWDRRCRRAMDIIADHDTSPRAYTNGGHFCEWRLNGGSTCPQRKTRKRAADGGWYCLEHMRMLYFIEQGRERAERISIAKEL